MTRRGTSIAVTVAALLGAVGGIALMGAIAPDDKLAYVGGLVGGAVVGVMCLAAVLGHIEELGEVTGLSDPDSRFPRLRRFLDRFQWHP